jgi:hypothetical protein
VIIKTKYAAIILDNCGALNNAKKVPGMAFFNDMRVVPNLTYSSLGSVNIHFSNKLFLTVIEYNHDAINESFISVD